MKAARLLDIESGDMKEIFSDYEASRSPSLFLALREALFREISSGNSPPTLWIHNSYGDNGMVTIGRNEKPTHVDFDACRRLGVPVYARTSGGWHIYNDANFIFVNVFVPSGDAKRFGIIESASDTAGAFRYNSRLAIEALASAGVADARMHPGDPSSILVNHNLIAVNSALLGRDALYMEGGIRYSGGDIYTSSFVLKMSDEERRDLFERNTSVTRYSSMPLERLKAVITEVYRSGTGPGYYEWSPGGLSEREIQRAAEYASRYRSLADMDPGELEKIGLHPGKICVVHWVEKYGLYTPGDY